MKKYYVFGDSLLRGVMPDQSGMYHSTNYIDFPKLSEQYNVVIENYSMPTYTVVQGFQWMKKIMHEKDVPDVVIIEFGGNDCDYDWKKIASDRNDNFEKHKTPINVFTSVYEQIIDYFMNMGVEVVVTKCPPFIEEYYRQTLISKNVSEKLINQYIYSSEKFQEEYDEYRNEIIKLAENKHCRVLDLYKEFENLGDLKDYYSCDGIHPNEKGYQLIHQGIKDFLSNEKKNE